MNNLASLSLRKISVSTTNPNKTSHFFGFDLSNEMWEELRKEFTPTLSLTSRGAFSTLSREVVQYAIDQRIANAKK